MVRLRSFKFFSLSVALAMACHGVVAFGQADIAWTGSGDGSTFSDDNNWFATEAGGSGVAGPELLFTLDSLKFSTAGTTIDNDLDPASNGGTPLFLNHGLGTAGDSGAFHFLAGSGEFTFTGFPVGIGVNNAHATFIRADAGAGTTQTLNMDINLAGGLRDRSIILENGGTVILNGQISSSNSWLFPNGTAGRIELNGDNIGPGKGLLGAGNNGGRAFLRNNVSGTVLAVGSDTAFGDPTTGTFEGEDDGQGGRTNTLQMRGLTANQILTVEANAPRDLSAYFFNNANGSGGGGIKIDNASDTTIGYLSRTGNGTRTFSNVNSGTVIIEHGIFASTNTTAQNTGIFAGGTVGNVEGGNGDIVVNGRLHNTLIDPTSAANFDVNGNGTLFEDNSSRGGIAATGQFFGGDGVTPVNGAINPRFGKVTLNADSSATWIGSQVVSSNFAIVVAGHDNAFGDSNSLVVLNNTGTVDIGTHTIEQRVVSNGGTLRGNGTLTNEGDWSIGGAVQPGGETPTTADTLTFDFTNNAVGNTLQFETGSTVEFVIDGGLASSTIDVFGPSIAGTTDVIFDGNNFSFTDLSGGSLTEGTYTLFDGDANTSITLNSGVTLAGIDAFPGSTVSVSGDDLVLNLSSAGGGDADFDSDGDVDGDDFLAWQTNVGFSAPVDLQPFGDANGDDAIDGLDLVVWETQYGSTPALSAASAVPEPGSLVLVLFGLTACVASRRVR